MPQVSETPNELKANSGSPSDWGRLADYYKALLGCYRLYFALAGLSVLLALFFYVISTPSYTATAVIGPPNPSPMNTLMSSLTGSTGAASGIGRRLFGGGGGNANDPFQEYIQLLHSKRLATELAEKDGLLPIIFAAQWDAKNKQWRPRGAVGSAIAAVKRVLRRPVKDYPDADDLGVYLESHFVASESTNRRSTLLNSSSGYMNVAFTFRDRELAAKILDTILFRADTIIREEQARDVRARIAYLRTEIPAITETEQKNGLIATLSGQEELQMMIMADHRYAATVIDPPNASPVPTSPGSPGRILEEALLLAGVIWMVLVGLALRSKILNRLVSIFGRKQ